MAPQEAHGAPLSPLTSSPVMAAAQSNVSSSPASNGAGRYWRGPKELPGGRIEKKQEKRIYYYLFVRKGYAERRRWLFLDGLRKELQIQDR